MKNPAIQYIDNLQSQSSRHQQTTVLNKAARLLSGRDIGAGDYEWHKIGRQDIMDLRRDLMRKDYAIATINGYLNAIRQVVIQCRRDKLITREEELDLNDIPRVRGRDITKGRRLEMDEYRHLIDTIEGHKKTRYFLRTRDAAMCSVALGCGARSGEVIKLQYDDVNFDENTILVHGKGNKTELLYMPESTAKRLQKWIAERGDYEGYLFYSTKGGGEEPLTRHGFYDTLKKWRIIAGLPKFTSHDFRRTTITNLFETRGGDLSAIQRFARHSSPQTTMLYDKRGSEVNRSIADDIEA